jgi:hypothetical protein
VEACRNHITTHALEAGPLLAHCSPAPGLASRPGPPSLGGHSCPPHLPPRVPPAGTALKYLTSALATLQANSILTLGQDTNYPHSPANLCNATAGAAAAPGGGPLAPAPCPAPSILEYVDPNTNGTALNGTAM